MKTPRVNNKLPVALKDPQNWISIIGVLTVIGLCAGAFEPLNTPVPTQAQTGQPALTIAAGAVRHHHGATLLASTTPTRTR